MPPAVYVDAGTYNRLTGSHSSGTDQRLDSLLELSSRVYDRLRGVAPGMFAPIGSTAFRFTPTGGTTLWLRDTAGDQYFLRTITANSLAIDYDQDGAYDDYAWDLADAWVRGLPENAASFGEPFTAIELNPYATSAPLSAWPTYKNSVQITGTWGWAVTPTAVQMRVADIAHGLSQRGYAGGYGAEEVLQQGLVPAWVVAMIDSSYSYRMPV